MKPFPVFAAALAALALAGCHKSDAAVAGVGATTAGAPVAGIAPPTGKAWSEVVVPTADGGMLMGNAAAPIKLVEYGSLSCPHCAHLAETMMPKLTGTYVASGKVSYEYRSFAIHPQDVPLTVLANCNGSGAFFGLVEQVYANFDPMNDRMAKGIKDAQAAMQLPAAQRMGAMSDALGYTEFFGARGLPTAKAHACLANTAAAAAVANHAKAYDNAGVDSTPTLFLNGAKLPSSTWPEIDAALQHAGA